MADRSVTYQFRGEFQNLRAGLAAAGSSVQDFGKKLTALDKQGAQMRAAFGTVGSAAGRMGVAAAGGLAFMTKAAMDWETAWTGVLKTVDGSPAELAKLEGGLRNLAKETGFAHAEVAAVAEAAGQLGISTGGVEDFTRVMLDMGVSTSMSSEEAATGLARLRNIMGSTEAEIANTGSAMVALGNNFATTESEILAMSQRLAGAGRQAGLSTSDVLGLATAMSSVGIEAEAGGTAMSLTMKRIGKEVETGGDKIDLFARTAGMSVEEFTRAWGEDAAGTLTRFVEGLGNAEQMGMSTNAVLRELGVTGIREADALLRLSGNAEGLAAALELSADGFRKNSDLAEEAGKFYGTSAQQVKQAWASIKDSAIDAGAAVLPVVEGVADVVAGLAGGFAALPGPIKSATGGLLGITAVLGGGLWFTSKAISGVANMREALQTLGVTAGRAKTGVDGVAATGSKFARFGRYAVGVLAVGTAVGQLADSMSRIDAQNLDRALSALGRGEVADEIKTIIDDIRYLDSWQGSVDLGELVTLGGIFGDSTMDKMANNIDQLDQKLAQLVETGESAQALEYLRAIVDETGMSAGESAQHFDALFLALRNAGESLSIGGVLESLANPLGLIGPRAEEAAGGIGGVGDAAGDASAEVNSLRDALDGLLGPTMDQDAATVAWKRSIQSLTDELEGGSDALNVNTERGQDNRDAIRDRVSALAAMIAADEEAGVEVETMQRKMLRGAEAIMEAATAAGIGEREMRGYLRQLGLTPKQINTLISNNAPEAKGKVDDLNTSLSRVPRHIQTQINVSLSGLSSAMSSLGNLNPLRNFGGSADGSTVPKDGGPYADRYPYLLAPGEEVISNRHGQADRHRPLLKAINAGRLADGGTVGGLASGGTAKSVPGSAYRSFDLRAGMTAKQINNEFDAFLDALKRAEKKVGDSFEVARKQSLRLAASWNKLDKQVERRADRLSSLRADRDSLVSAAAGSFNNDIFGNGVAGLRLQLEADRNDARAMRRALAGTKGLGKGLMAALASSGDLATAQELAGMSRREVRQLSRLYDQRGNAQAALGTYAGDAVYGREIKAMTAELRESRQERRRLNRALNTWERAAERMPNATAREIRRAVNQQALPAGRRSK